MKVHLSILLSIVMMSLIVLAEDSSYENLFSSGSRAEQADAKFEKKMSKKTKEFASVELTDRKEGLSIVFSADALERGQYTLRLSDSCHQKVSVKLGDFNTTSGNISTEFIKEGISVGDKFESVVDKVIILNKVPKKGKPSPVGCATIIKRNSGAQDQASL